MSKIEDSLINDFKSFLESEEGIQGLKERENRRILLSKVFTKKNIENMEQDQFESIIRKLWASEFWHKKDYLIERIEENGFENIKDAFYELLYGTKTLNKRYDNFRNKIKYIGPSMVTEIISFTYPNKYCIWNDKPKNVLPYLKFDIELPERVFKYQINGENYVKCIGVMKKVKDQLTNVISNPDFIDTDLFLYYVFSRVMSKVEIPEKKEEKIEIKEPADFLKKEKKYTIKSHSDAQGVLLKLGNKLKFDTYVAKEDQKKTFGKKTLGDIAILEDVPSFSLKRIVDIAKHIDVIWFREEFPEFCFEIEQSTPVTNGLNRFAELEKFKVSMFIVGPKSKFEKFKKEINRYSFRSIKENTKFFHYDKLEEFYNVTKKYITLRRGILGD